MISYIKSSIFRLMYKVYLWSSASSNESFLYSRQVEYPFVIEELKKTHIPEGSKVLLVGCAGDPLSTILPALGYETFGLDVKHVAIEYPNFHFTRGDIRKREFPDRYFDVVIAVSVIEHVGVLEGDYRGDEKAMKEIHRILKPRGLFINTSPICLRAKTKNFERIYDYDSIRSLFKTFTILREKIFQKNEEGCWVECSVSELNDGSEAVFLVSAMKRDTL